MASQTLYSTRTLCSLVLLLVLAAACGDAVDEAPPQPPGPSWKNVEPTLFMVTPNTVAVGDVITVLGGKFVQPSHGKVYLRFKGQFHDGAGNATAVDHTVQATVENEGKLTWRLWPNIVFHPRGDRLGVFVGNLTALNQGKDGSTKYSAPLPAKVTVGPSLIPRIVRPNNTNCGSIVDGALAGRAMTFTVEAVGLRPGSKDNPLVFSWVFLAQNWEVSFDHGTLDPKAVVPKTGALVVEDRVTDGAISTITDGGSKSFLLKVGSDLLGSTRLKVLKTGKISGGMGKVPASVNVAAVDASGKQLKLPIRLTIYPQAYLEYRGETKLAERFPPVQVSDCIPGNDIGREVTYTESKTESRSRALNFNWNANMGINAAPIPQNPFALGIEFSVSFGVNVGETYSSDKAKSLNISGNILPGEYGVFYRQTTKLYRIGRMMMATECGKQFHGGDAVLTDWLFTPELATGPACVPKSNLPPAQKWEE